VLVLVLVPGLPLELAVVQEPLELAVVQEPGPGPGPGSLGLAEGRSSGGHRRSSGRLRE
jgi:hypothetical protein